jgi:hypothetical protein
LRNVKAVEVAEKLGMKEAIRYERVDEKQGMLYYIEGFVYSPDRGQRELLRELETILHTFKAGGNEKIVK